MADLKDESFIRLYEEDLSLTRHRLRSFINSLCRQLEHQRITEHFEFQLFELLRGEEFKRQETTTCEHPTLYDLSIDLASGTIYEKQHDCFGCDTASNQQQEINLDTWSLHGLAQLSSALFHLYERLLQ